MITIRVDESKDQQDFVIYEKLIRKSSTFIDNELNKPWRGSTSRVVALPEFTYTTFGVYHLWLHTGQLHSRCDPTEVAGWYRQHIESMPEPKVSLEACALSSEIINLELLSRLAHYLLDTDFMDTVNDAIIQCVLELDMGREWFSLFRHGPEIYKVVPEGSPTRSLLVDLIAWTADSPQIAKLREGPLSPQDKEVHAEFTMDVLQVIASRFLSKTPSTSPLEGWQTSCKYHSHGDEKPCYRKKTEKYVTVTAGEHELISQQDQPICEETPCIG